MFTIDIDPSRNARSEIERWLRAERQATDKGFYVNWSVIARAFNDERIYVLTVEGQAIAFLVWSIWGDEADFAILEVKPDFRRRGYGRRLAEETMRMFAKYGVRHVSVECEPPESEQFWRRLGFTDDPSPAFGPSASVRLRKQL